MTRFVSTKQLYSIRYSTLFSSQYFLRHLSAAVPTRTSLSNPLFGIPKKTKLPPRPKWLIVESELEEKFLKGGRGPGGQKINKTNSKVQLKHIPTGITVTCQYSRSQENNRKKAREILALKLDDLQNPGTSRNAILQERFAKVKQSKEKKSNRKYRKLDEEKKSKADEDQAVIEDPEEEFERMMEKFRKGI